MARGFLDEDGPRASDLVDLAIEVQGESEKAWKVTDGAVTVWVPKSQSDMAGGVLTLPEWLAKEKGLI